MSVSVGERPPSRATQQMIPLTADEIHLWLAFYEEISDEDLLARYRRLLNAEEQAQEPRFYFARDRRRYLVTRALVRTVLSRYAPIAPREWIFKTNAYGRPEVANTLTTEVPPTFNISHTHSLIVLGITKHRQLGVDVENVCTRQASIDVADRYFAKPEVTVLLAAPQHEHQFRFFEYWTFKESYIKARGMGLSLPLDKFSFCYPDDQSVEIAIDAELGDDSTRWQFWQLRPSAEYLVAVCAERLGARSPRLIARKAVPLWSEEPVTLERLRVSESIADTDNADHADNAGNRANVN